MSHPMVTPQVKLTAALGDANKAYPARGWSQGPLGIMSPWLSPAKWSSLGVKALAWSPVLAPNTSCAPKHPELEISQNKPSHHTLLPQINWDERERELRRLKPSLFPLLSPLHAPMLWQQAHRHNSSPLYTGVAPILSLICRNTQGPKTWEVFCSSFQLPIWELKTGLYSQHFICKTAATCKALSRVISKTCFSHSRLVAALGSQPASGPLFRVLWKSAVSATKNWS